MLMCVLQLKYSHTVNTDFTDEDVCTKKQLLTVDDSSGIKHEVAFLIESSVVSRFGRSGRIEHL